MFFTKRLFFALIVVIFPTLCWSQENRAASLYNNGVVFSGSYKIGEPYKIGKTSYVPKIDKKYSEVGLATVYDKAFLPATTANGEKFSSIAIAGGHKTLPLPSIVKVTNLESNKVAYVRINDRGPLAEGKIIVLTESASKILGLDEFGLSQVKVEYDEEETNKMLLHPSHQVFKEKFVLLNELDKDAVEKYTKNEKTQEKEIVKVAESIEVGRALPKNEVTTQKDFGNLNDEKRFSNASANKFYIQLGVFNDLENVNNIVKKFKGFSNFEITTKANDKLVLYRLKAGPFFQEDKQEVIDNFIKLGFKDPLIVKD